jgi:hypothetical protein
MVFVSSEIIMEAEKSGDTSVPDNILPCIDLEHNDHYRFKADRIEVELVDDRRHGPVKFFLKGEEVGVGQYDKGIKIGKWILRVYIHEMEYNEPTGWRVTDREDDDTGLSKDSGQAEVSEESDDDTASYDSQGRRKEYIKPYYEDTYVTHVEEGYYVNDKRHGHWKISNQYRGAYYEVNITPTDDMYNTRSVDMDIVYKNDLKHGSFSYVKTDGVVKTCQGLFIDDYAEAIWTCIDDSKTGYVMYKKGKQECYTVYINGVISMVNSFYYIDDGQIIDVADLLIDDSDNIKSI